MESVVLSRRACHSIDLLMTAENEAILGPLSRYNPLLVPPDVCDSEPQMTRQLSSCAPTVNSNVRMSVKSVLLPSTFTTVCRRELATLAYTNRSGRTKLAQFTHMRCRHAALTSIKFSVDDRGSCIIPVMLLNIRRHPTPFKKSLFVHDALTILKWQAQTARTWTYMNKHL